MTREEAKEILTHNWTRVDNPNYSELELDEAFFMAIEALSERNIARDIATILENEQDMRVILQNDAESDDLIIKGAKGIQDGLYNIKDGKLFKYKAKGGTVRTYPIVPSADAVHGEWIIRENGNKECSLCGHERQDGWDYFCGYCGARMKGGAE